MILIPTANDNLLILHGMDFIYWRVIFFFDRNRSTLDHHFSLSLPLDHHYSLSILRITLLSCCDGRMILIPAVNDNLLILHGTDVFYGCFIIYIPVNATFQHTVRSPWCFEQRVITPANNNNLIARNVRLSWDYEQMLSQPAVIDNLFIIAFHGVYFFYSGDCSTPSGEWCSNIICLINHISQYYIIHIPKTTNTMPRC